MYPDMGRLIWLICLALYQTLSMLILLFHPVLMYCGTGRYSMIHPMVYPGSSIPLSIPSSCIMGQIGMSQVPGMMIHFVLMYHGTGRGLVNQFSTKTCIVNCMHESNHIDFSVWQWNRGHLLLHESSGCPKLGHSYTFSKSKLSGLRPNHLAWATTLEGFEKSAQTYPKQEPTNKPSIYTTHH